MQFVDIHFVHLEAEGIGNVLEQIVRKRSRRLDILKFQGDRLCFEATDDNGKFAFSFDFIKNERIGSIRMRARG